MKSLSACAREIFKAALEGADARQAVKGSLTRKGSRLLAGGASYDLARVSRIFVVGAGKAAGPMAQGLEEMLGPWKIAKGLVLVPPGDRTRLRHVRKHTADHPIPSRRGVEGCGQILDILQAADRRDLVIALISGGASAMAALPAPGISLRDLQRLTSELLRSGASIAAINGVRKHLSATSGGRMAEAAFPARVLVLVASDVEGNHLDVIGSGPFAPDRSTFRDAEKVLRQAGIWRRAAPAIRARILAGASPAGGRRVAGAGSRIPGGRGPAPDFSETPKPGAPCFDRVRHVIVADRMRLLEAASERASELGFKVRQLVRRDVSFGDIETVAKTHIREARREVRAQGAVCLLSSGESSVHIPRSNRGLGGRNQELALRLGVALVRSEDSFAVLCAGSDGIDGPTDAAGAWIDANLLAAAERAKLNPQRSIENHDSYRFFNQLGQGLLRTGRTGTNLLDLRIILLRSRSPH